MSETTKRRLERREITQTIAITNVINGRNFGELVNVTAEGMMAMIDREISTQSIFQLSLELPVEIEGSKNILLGADCLWCRKADNFHRYWAGFHIIDISDTGIVQLETLIEQHAK